MTRKATRFCRRPPAHRLKPFIAREKGQITILLPGQRARHVEHRGELVGVTFVETIQIGLYCRVNYRSFIGHGHSLLKPMNAHKDMPSGTPGNKTATKEQSNDEPSSSDDVISSNSSVLLRQASDDCVVRAQHPAVLGSHLKLAHRHSMLLVNQKHMAFIRGEEEILPPLA